jgi:hypothetical protein
VLWLGDADGLGATRKKELVKSGLQLGLRNKDDVLIIEDTWVLRSTQHQAIVL